jgi:DNA-binding PadR family transcriptional regulator
MRLITRAEELVLVSVWRLQDGAYCVPIRELLMEVTKKTWSFGSVYDALDRLEKKGYLRSHLSEPSKSRGGRSKRIYKHTKMGLRAMIEIKNVQDMAWEGISKLVIESKL